MLCLLSSVLWITNTKRYKYKKITGNAKPGRIWMKNVVMVKAVRIMKFHVIHTLDDECCNDYILKCIYLILRTKCRAFFLICYVLDERKLTGIDGYMVSAN